MGQEEGTVDVREEEAEKQKLPWRCRADMGER